MSSIEGRLIDLQERVERHNETRNTRRDLQGSFAVPRQGSSRRPNNLFTKNQLPTFPVQSPHVVETENRMRDIHKISGKLSIRGTEYRSAIEDLQTLGDLGSGTCGHVVKMLHKPSEEIIAVKQMRRSGNSDENKRILMDLDVVVQSNDCPYIVRCYGCFITDTDVWICMELMATCFDKLLKRLRMPVPEAILGKVTVATVNALSYLKDKHKVIHRDVKPSNILLDERGNVKLCDFGISGRLVDSKAKTRTAGCAAYLAPERIEPPDPHRPSYDIRADVWSLGISLVELATGMFPYRNCKHDIELLSRVVNEEPPQLPSDSDFSPEFKSFVSQCLTKNYRDRPKYAKLLKHPFVVKSELSDVSVGDWYASLPTSGTNTPAKTATVTTTAVFNVNQTSQLNGINKQPINDYSAFLNLNREGSVASRENFVPIPRENYLPTRENYVPNRENYVPSTRENYVPNRENYVPSTRENYVLSTRDNFVPSTRENFIPSTRENFIPGSRENYIPSTRENNYLTNFRENNYVTSLRDNVLGSRENYVLPPREDRVNFVPGLRDEHRVNNYLTSHNGEPRNYVTSTLYWTPEQVTPTPQRPWWTGTNVGGSSSQPTSLDTDYDSLSPYPRRKAIEGSSSPPPLPARRVSLDHRLKASPASSGNTSPIVLQRFHHQNQQRRSRVDLHSTPRHRSLSREHSAGRSPEPPPRISRQRYMLGHNLSSSTDIEPPPLHERLHAPLPLFNRERLAEGRSHSLTRAELRNGHLAEPPSTPGKHLPEDQSWLQSLAGLVKRRISGLVKPVPPSLQRVRLAPQQPRCPEGECWSLPGSPRPPRAPRHPH